LQTKLIAADELDALMVFVDYKEMNRAFALIKGKGCFAKIITTPKKVFAASSLSIAVREKDLKVIKKEFEATGITPIKSVLLKQCALDFQFQSL